MKVKISQDLVRILSELLDRIIPDDYELIVVDDDSPDLTWELACELMPSYPSPPSYAARNRARTFNSGHSWLASC